MVKSPGRNGRSGKQGVEPFQVPGWLLQPCTRTTGIRSFFIGNSFNTGYDTYSDQVTSSAYRSLLRRYIARIAGCYG